MDPEVIGVIWFDDASSYPQVVTFIEEVSELLWGCSGDGTREPFTIEETIERLREFSDKALAWDRMLEYANYEGFNDDQRDVCDIMESEYNNITKEVSE
tara:strand:+ start:515 stop:811 length:297 start_codon:yes stop_codon:yes gene_type:complete